MFLFHDEDWAEIKKRFPNEMHDLRGIDLELSRHISLYCASSEEEILEDIKDIPWRIDAWCEPGRNVIGSFACCLGVDAILTKYFSNGTSYLKSTEVKMSITKSLDGFCPYTANTTYYCNDNYVTACVMPIGDCPITPFNFFTLTRDMLIYFYSLVSEKMEKSPFVSLNNKIVSVR